MEALLEATVRDTIGKNEARRTRREGRVPAVIYGAGDTTSIAVDPKALLKILHSEAGANTLISLKLGGQDAKVLVKDFQLDPITHQVLHADFYRVAMDKMIVTNTIPQSKASEACSKIVVLSVARLLGQAIKSIHEETSVSSLFV